jgi:spore coat polysaccharide biosynthesis protein SpsF (cytidylyltransferase family)
MRKAVFVSARTASSRLPQKSNLFLYGETSLISHVLKRAKLAETDLVVLCTTNEASDDILVQFAQECGVEVFRGSTQDKLARWLGACEAFDVDAFVTMDGDDPFCDPSLAVQAFNQLEQCDFVESSLIVTGGFTYAIKTDALRKVCEIKDSENTEMMWTYFKDTGLFRIEELKEVDRELIRDDIRLTLDYAEDLQLFRIIFEILGAQEAVSLLEVVRLLSDRNDLRTLNFFRQGEFLSNQASKTELRLKGDFN